MRSYPEVVSLRRRISNNIKMLEGDSNAILEDKEAVIIRSKKILNIIDMFLENYALATFLFTDNDMTWEKITQWNQPQM